MSVGAIHLEKCGIIRLFFRIVLYGDLPVLAFLLSCKNIAHTCENVGRALDQRGDLVDRRVLVVSRNGKNVDRAVFGNYQKCDLAA